MLLYVLCNSWHAALPTHWIWTHEIEILDPWNCWKKLLRTLRPAGSSNQIQELTLQIWKHGWCTPQHGWHQPELSHGVFSGDMVYIQQSYIQIHHPMGQNHHSSWVRVPEQHAALFTTTTLYTILIWLYIHPSNGYHCPSSITHHSSSVPRVEQHAMYLV